MNTLLLKMNTESKRNPLVKNFQDVAFRCPMHFMNDQYQDRASLPTYICTATSIKINDTYIVKCKYPHYLQSFIKDYSITGEHNLEISVVALGCRLASAQLLSSVTIERDTLKDFVSKNSLGKKETNPDSVCFETQVFFAHILNDDLFPAKFTFKKNRNGLTPMYFEVELPCSVCDQWYEFFAKYDYQVAKGPKLI